MTSARWPVTGGAPKAYILSPFLVNIASDDLDAGVECTLSLWMMLRQEPLLPLGIEGLYREIVVDQKEVTLLGCVQRRATKAV